MIINDYYHCHYHYCELSRPGLPVWCNNLLQLGFELSGVSCVADKPLSQLGIASHTTACGGERQVGYIRRFKTLTRLHPRPLATWIPTHKNATDLLQPVAPSGLIQI